MSKKVRGTIERLFHFYSTNYPNQASNVEDSRDEVMKDGESVFEDSFDFEFESIKDEQDILKNKNELDRYLVEAKEKSTREFDVLA